VIGLHSSPDREALALVEEHGGDVEELFATCDGCGFLFVVTTVNGRLEEDTANITQDNGVVSHNGCGHRLKFTRPHREV
jgi:hypothetical protein